MLTVGTVESFHVFRRSGLRAPGRPQGSVSFPGPQVSRLRCQDRGIAALDGTAQWVNR
jgi:hypothetical protein